MSTSERLDLADMVDNIELKCEANGHEGFRPAVWVVRQVECCQRKTVGLACDPCLQRYLASPGARCGDCGTSKKPARLWIHSYEPIDSPAK